MGEPTTLVVRLRRGHLSDQEFDLLATLHEALISHTALDEYDNRGILEDPAWHAVVAKAERIRQQLLALTADPIEQLYLRGQIGTP